MKTLARRLWEEPALFLSALVGAVELVLQLVGATGALAVLAPIAGGVGIRQLVAPTTRQDPVDPALLAPPGRIPD
jgi:hypothetical protein